MQKLALFSFSFLILISKTAFAQAVPASTPSSMEAFLLPLVFMMGIFYLLVWRPQQKRGKEQAAMLTSLKRGDEVITSGGIYGKIAGLTDKVLTLEIADNVKIKILRTQVLKKASEEVSATAAVVNKGANT